MTNPPGRRAALAPQPEEPRWQFPVIIGGLAVCAILLAAIFMLPGPHKVKGLSHTEVFAAIDSGELNGKDVRWIEVDDNSRAVILTLAGGDEVAAHYPENYGEALISRLEASGIPFETRAPAKSSIWETLLITLLPVFFIIGALVWLVRRSGLGAAKALTGKASALGTVPETTFADVVGCDEAVEELAEIASFLSDATRFDAAGARMPKGFLLVGPPGTGKTLMARAVAGEASVPFYAVAGSDFTEMFVGLGAARVRDLFKQAKKTGGIVFLDELDSVGKARSGNPAGGAGADEREGTLNALLVEMDGFGKEDNVIVLAATNRPDVLDPALLRAGRFDRQVTVPAPDRRGRTALLELYAKDRRLDPTIDLVALARRMPGLTGADIANLMNQAALEAARASRERISSADLDEALATIMMGRARRTAVVTDRDRAVTAWHEAGHAVAALVLPDAHDPVQVTIVPRGHAGGVTWMGGDDDSFLTRSQTHARLAVSMAGRAGEELLLGGDFTQGAAGDLQSATALAFRMVTEWGMSSLGLAAMGAESAEPGVVRAEVDRLLAAALGEARQALAEHRELLDRVVAELLLEETIDGDRLSELRAESRRGEVTAA